MKKPICLLLSAVLLTGLMGCAALKPVQPETKTATVTPQSQTVPETTAKPTEALTASLRFSELEMTAPGETCRLYNGTAKAEAVTFGTDDPSVVTFDQGIAVCKSEGTAVVFAEYAGQRQECTVTCTFPTEREVPVTLGGSIQDPVLAPPTSAYVDSSFFDDAVFVGDSVSVMLSWHAADSGVLGDAQFLVKESYSAVHASGNSMLLDYNGQEMVIEDAVAATGAKKVFLMLGTNDIGYMSLDDTISNWRDILKRIQNRCPGVKIYIQSATPIYTKGQKGSLNNEKMDELNSRLQVLAEEYGCTFLNIAPYLKDGTNGLAECYCSDGYVHLTYSGADVWVRALKALL